MLQSTIVAALPRVVLLPWLQALVTRWPGPILPHDEVVVSVLPPPVSVPFVHRAATYWFEPGLLQFTIVAALPRVRVGGPAGTPDGCASGGSAGQRGAATHTEEA